MQKTLAIINLSAIRSNVRTIRSMIGERAFYAVVKADAYGHGAIEVAREIEDMVDGFCVAIADEGVALRLSGVIKPILVLTPPLDGYDVSLMEFYNLAATVSDLNSARLARNISCHLAINSGMNRYGCNPDGLDDMLSMLSAEKIVGVYSHMFAPNNSAVSAEQLRVFNRAAEIVKSYAPRACAHFAASGGIAVGGNYLQEGVRCGLMLYGYPPEGFKVKGLQPALRVYARLAQTTRPVGRGVGYNIASERYSQLYTYRAGYADGFWRGVPLGEKTLCMDAFISKERASLTPIMTDAAEYAKRCGTIVYEALCSVTRRSERVYER